MKEGDGFQSKKTPVSADYDSDETVVDDSVLGSDEEDDEFYSERMLINGDVSQTFVSLCPEKINVGNRSPEIHFFSKFVPATHTECTEAATKQVSGTLEEEASQSLLRNWHRNPQSKIPLLRDSGHCQPPADYTDLCEDSQELFDSSELVIPENNSIDELHTSLLTVQSDMMAINVSCPGNKMVSVDNIEALDVQYKEHNIPENNSTDESQKTSLLSLQSAMIAIDDPRPENNTVSLDNIEALDVQYKEHNVSKVEDSNIVNEEAKFRRLTDEMSVDQLLDILCDSNSLPELTVDELSFLEITEDGSNELNITQLEATHSQVESSRDGRAVEGIHPEREAYSNCSNEHMQTSILLCTDENGKHNTEENGSYTKKIDKKTEEVTFVAEESSDKSPSSLKSLGWVPLFNVEQSVTLQDSNENLILNKDSINIVSWNGASHSQTSPSILVQVIPGTEVSKTAACENAVRRSKRNCSKTLYDITNEEQLPAKTAQQLLNQQGKSSESEEDKQLCKNARSQKTDIKRRFQRTTSSTALLDNKSKRRPGDGISHPKSKRNTCQPPEHEKTTEHTQATEIIPKKKAKVEILRNERRRGESGNRTEPASGTYGREESGSCTPPDLCESTRVNRTGSVQCMAFSKTKRNIHKRDFAGETYLHKACRKGDLEEIKALIEAGIDVNQKDNAGWIAIHEASCKGNTEAILTLIQAGADINCKGLDGILPLHDAVYGNHFEAVKILLEFGANPYEKDNQMRNAFDKCGCDEMAEVLKSHNRIIDTPLENGTAKPCLASDTDECRPEDTCSVEILDTLHGIQNKHLNPLVTELEASEDAEPNGIQNMLNNIVNLQKTEGDIFAKEYRASPNSLQQGILRDKQANLPSNQKTLPQVERSQKVTLKIIAHQQARRSEANNGETSSTLHYRDTSPGRNQISASCAVNEWLQAKAANGNAMTTKIPVLDRVPDTEGNGSATTISRCISSTEVSRTAEVPTDSLMSEARCHSNLTSKQKPEELEMSPLSFDSCSSIINDDLESTAPVNKSHSSFPLSIPLNIMAKYSISIEGVSHRKPFERYEAADTDLQLQKSDYEEAIQQIDDDFPGSASGYCRPHQKAIGQTSDDKLNQTGHQSNVRKPACEKQHTCVETERKLRKLPLRKLMKLGKIKPGVDVLSFQLQDYSHKATLLCDGQVTDCSGTIFRDPAHWVKSLLGDNISVTWKYVADKVTYIGNKLSSYIGQDDIEEPQQEKKNAVSQSLPPPGHTVLQVTDILLVDKSEFFPSHIMEKYWEELMNSDSQDF